MSMRNDKGQKKIEIKVGDEMNYYEGSGKKWEREEMIKERKVEGDRL